MQGMVRFDPAPLPFVGRPGQLIPLRQENAELARDLRKSISYLAAKAAGRRAVLRPEVR